MEITYWSKLHVEYFFLGVNQNLGSGYRDKGLGIRETCRGAQI